MSAAEPSAWDTGIDVAQALAPIFASASMHMSVEQRVEWLGAFLAFVHGMAQDMLGHAAAREVFARVAALGPAKSLTSH